MELSDSAIVTARPARNDVSAWHAYQVLAEPECAASGDVEEVLTVFLTNRECPLRCVMCDLWKNTLTETVPRGAIPAQIDEAIARFPTPRHIKLYNSGNFFDPQAIPVEDSEAIAERLRPYTTVIVENHPRFCGQRCHEFRQRIPGEFEVAMGLETVHPDVLPKLNKRMTLDDFDAAAARLLEWEIALRAFVLLQPPFMEPEASEEWCLRSVEHAFDVGVRVCAIIPTRAGNGIMETLGKQGLFSPPPLSALERVHEETLRWERGRVFVDLWDAAQLRGCPACKSRRIDRLEQMNLQQRVLPLVVCDECESC